MNLLVLFGFIAVRMVADIPRAAANSVGIGFKDEFVFGGKTIKRPKHFNTKAHKAAFERVGSYLTDVLARDAMEVFRASHIATDDFWGYKKMASLDIWAEVLAFFENEGCLTCYWVLRIPDGECNYLRTPYWGPDGEDLVQPEVGAIGGVVADSAPFTPGLLTESQKAEILNKGYYAKHPNRSIGGWNRRQQKQEFVPIKDENFERLYHRNRQSLSKADLEKGALKLVTILATSQSR